MGNPLPSPSLLTSFVNGPVPEIVGLKSILHLTQVSALSLRSIQACVVTSLRKNFPGLAVIGEEKEDEVEKDVPADWIVAEEDAEATKMEVPKEYRESSVDQVGN